MDVQSRGLPHLSIDWSKMNVELDKVLEETANVSHVYAMQYGPYVKFGVTVQLLQRYNNIYTDMIIPRMWQLPLELKNLSLRLNAYCMGDQFTESLIHRKFRHKNVKFGLGNEWFEIDKDIELFINLMSLHRLAKLDLEAYLREEDPQIELLNQARLLWLEQHPNPQDQFDMGSWLIQKSIEQKI